MVRVTTGLEPFAGARIRKKEKIRKIKNKGGGGICAPRAQHGRVPLLSIFAKLFQILSKYMRNRKVKKEREKNS